MKCFFVALFWTIAIHSFAQADSTKLILDRKLTWADFTGEVDKGSKYSAMTYWYVNYKYQVRWNSFSDTVTASFTVEPLFGNRSWVKTYAKSDELLKHEQGHYDLAIICAEMLRENFAKATFLKNDYAQKVDSIFQSTEQLIKQMELQYDAETNHMLNREEQQRWDENITRLLAMLPAKKNQ